MTHGANLLFLLDCKSDLYEQASTADCRSVSVKSLVERVDSLGGGGSAALADNKERGVVSSSLVGSGETGGLRSRGRGASVSRKASLSRVLSLNDRKILLLSVPVSE